MSTYDYIAPVNGRPSGTSYDLLRGLDPYIDPTSVSSSSPDGAAARKRAEGDLAARGAFASTPRPEF